MLTSPPQQVAKIELLTMHAMLFLVEVRDILELVSTATAAVVSRQQMLAQLYQALPRYATATFWCALIAIDIPLEILVRCLRAAQARGDLEGRNHIMEIIVRRTQSNNEIWARCALYSSGIPPSECEALIDDLYADLCEHMLRALLDQQRRFWEENFVQCMFFERKHAFHSLLVREGHWRRPGISIGTRIPRIFLSSLEQVAFQEEHGSSSIEDERMQVLLHSIEARDLLALVLKLPEQFKALVLLVFWEGRTEKEIASVLGVTDRTVRNWLRKALQTLRCLLEREALL